MTNYPIEFHRVLLGTEPTDLQKRFYSSHCSGWSGHPTEESIESSIVLGLSTQSINTQVVIVTTKLHFPIVLNGIELISNTAFEILKSLKPDEDPTYVVNGYTTLFKKLKLIAIPIGMEAPERFISIGFSKHSRNHFSTTPEWLQNTLFGSEE